MSCPYTVSPIHAFNDNYIWAITRSGNSDCVVVDPGDGATVQAYLVANNLTLAAILITHHHHDHIGGVNQLLNAFGTVPVYGPSLEAQDVVTHPLVDNDIVAIESLNLTFTVSDVPGHTLGHIAYNDNFSLFCGDTLFSGGCGRMFEGTAAMFQQSLAKLRELPATTHIYCAHEYTLSNLAFANTVLPACSAIEHYIEKCTTLRRNNTPTIPSTIGIERNVNLFLNTSRPDVQLAIAQHYQLECINDAVANFKLLRQWKDVF